MSTMAISDDLVKSLKNPTPLYALAGTADLAAEKLRQVPGRLRQVRENGAPVLDTDLRRLRDQAQEFALQQLGRAAEYAVRAREAYDELALRGKDAVGTWRGGAADGVVEVATVIEPDPATPAAAAPAPETPAPAARGRRRPAAKKADPAG
jgi:hypothetical protein